MFAIEARKMGYRVHTFSPESDTPTGQVADIETCADYGDLDAVRDFAGSVDVVTFEFENVPSATIEAAASLVDVHRAAIFFIQHKIAFGKKPFYRKTVFL